MEMELVSVLYSWLVRTQIRSLPGIIILTSVTVDGTDRILARVLIWPDRIPEITRTQKQNKEEARPEGRLQAAGSTAAAPPRRHKYKCLPGLPTGLGKSVKCQQNKTNFKICNMARIRKCILVGSSNLHKSLRKVNWLLS